MSREFVIWTGLKFFPEASSILETAATIRVSQVGELNDWHAEASTAQVIFVRGTTFITGEVMDRIGPQLRIVARNGIGVDRVDIEAATQRGILVINTPDGPTESTAEHAIALLLNLCKKVALGDRILRSGQGFPIPGAFAPGLETAGTTLGLVGLGRIGSRVALIAKALGMRVLAYDPFITPQRAEELGVEIAPTLADLLPQAQVVSIHCPSIPSTYHIINAETLRQMPEGSYLINVSRGALIDHPALIDALRSGHLAGAGLDVFDPEPPEPDDPLFSLPNTICTPHIGSYTTAGLIRMQVMACQQVVSVLRNERPPNLVNPEAWDKRRQ
ncbi:MAG TPA: hydroxyacid dehydrogenase [Ktedonobacteraceae bacterium]|jgi:D-3-phosphoglycerate dehydrogenase|nr:hydroxyacid dehydrogenase [Ktedonobacteraceae bacterium]